MNTNYQNLYIYKFSNLIIGTLLFIIYWLLVISSPPQALAQELSLSISPPISEVVMEPGKENELNYVLTNNGADTILSAHIYPFSPTGEVGNVNLEKDLLEDDPAGLASWFSFTSPAVNLGGKFVLKSGDSVKVVLKLIPPKTTTEGDYYFSLVFATQNDSFLGNDGVAGQIKIGSNILLTVSKDGNPKKVASIVEFSAPRMIDSFAREINYKVRIANNGSAFFKPNGTITIYPIFGTQKTLSLAPQNIAVASTREIYCLEKEALIPCRLHEKVFIGTYKAVLNFTADNTDITYSKEVVTIAFPIYLTIAVTSVIILIIFIFKLPQKIKKNIYT